MPHLHEAARRKGPYVPAPYLSPKTFTPFAIVQKSHGFIPNFFRAQTLLPDLLEAELEAVGRILLPEDVLTRVQKECILLAVSAAISTLIALRCIAIYCAAWVCLRRKETRSLWTIMNPACRKLIEHCWTSRSNWVRVLRSFPVKMCKA